MLKRFTPLTAFSSAALLTISGTAMAEELSGAMEDVQESVEVIQQMKRQDDNLNGGLDAAKAVFVVPDYATAALIVGGTGGEGVLFESRDGQFSNPVFYDIGSLSIGAQAGASAGSIALLLMSDDAVESFKQENNFSLNAEAGLTIINWSAEAEWSAGKGDVVVWSDTEGLLAEAAVGVSDINFDEEETQEYYNEQATPQQILAGEIQNPHASELESEFAAFTGQNDGQAAGQRGAMGDHSMDDPSMGGMGDQGDDLDPQEGDIGDDTMGDADFGADEDY